MQSQLTSPALLQLCTMGTGLAGGPSSHPNVNQQQEGGRAKPAVEDAIWKNRTTTARDSCPWRPWATLSYCSWSSWQQAEALAPPAPRCVTPTDLASSPSRTPADACQGHEAGKCENHPGLLGRASCSKQRAVAVKPNTSALATTLDVLVCAMI